MDHPCPKDLTIPRFVTRDDLNVEPSSITFRPDGSIKVPPKSPVSNRNAVNEDPPIPSFVSVDDLDVEPSSIAFRPDGSFKIPQKAPVSNLNVINKDPPIPRFVMGDDFDVEPSALTFHPDGSIKVPPKAPVSDLHVVNDNPPVPRFVLADDFDVGPSSLTFRAESSNFKVEEAHVTPSKIPDPVLEPINEEELMPSSVSPGDHLHQQIPRFIDMDHQGDPSSITFRPDSSIVEKPISNSEKPSHPRKIPFVGLFKKLTVHKPSEQKSNTEQVTVEEAIVKSDNADTSVEFDA